MIIARNIFVIVVIAALSYEAGVKTFHAPAPPVCASPCKEFDETKRKLQELSETDYQEYLKLKESPEKARKAEDLLSKIMLLFIADMGLKLQAPPKVSPPNNAAPPSSETPPATAASERKKKPGAPARTWVASESAVTGAFTESDAVKETKNTEVPNLFDELRTSGPLNATQLTALNGVYVGDVTFTDGTPPWTVEWTVDAQYVDGALKGSQDIKLSKQGQVFSQTKGSGGLTDDFMSAKDSAAIFVKTNGNQGYFQLYPVDRTQGMVGSYYKKQGFDNYTPSGTVVLRKR